MERYVIRGGQVGFDRLAVLAKVHGPGTSTLLDTVGVQPGMTCLDLGCGGGGVTVELARRVGPRGRVIGVDADATVVGLAREAAEAYEVTNIEFRVGNVYDISESEAYDVVYCRFLLHHLSRPRDLLRLMWGAVRPGGSIVTEDGDFGGMFCEPPSEAADFFARVYPELIRRIGGDPGSGRMVYRYFLDAGIPAPELSLVQPVYATGQEKSINLLSVEAIAHEVVAEGLATEAEIQSTISALADYTDDPRTVLGSPRVFQVWARK